MRERVQIEKRRPLTRREVIQLISYDPAGGAFTWRARPRDAFTSLFAHRSWNAKHAGKPAFHMTNAQGYLVGRLCGRRFPAHRVAWLVVHGYWPAIIDHIDGDRTNNRADNLREVTMAENSRNTFMRRDNTSGHAGVHLHRATGKWRAHIHAHGRCVHLGLFSDIEEAAAARRRALTKHGFSERHGERRP